MKNSEIRHEIFYRFSTIYQERMEELHTRGRDHTITDAKTMCQEVFTQAVEQLRAEAKIPDLKYRVSVERDNVTCQVNLTFERYHEHADWHLHKAYGYWTKL